MRASTLILSAAALLAAPAAASPYQPLVQFSPQAKRSAALELRGCANPCGWEGQYCCESDQTCSTSADVAMCVAGGGATAFAGAAGGNYQMYTTTYVEVDSTTVTSTGSYLLSPAAGTPYATPYASPGTGGGIQCPSDEQSCGTLCCAADQVCGSPGQCVAGGASQSAFIRPTSQGVATITAAATTTMPFTAPVNSGGAVVSASPSNSGLSGGAIAGIVIGVLVGLFILFLVLACLCCKGVIDALMALLGLGKKKRVEETIIETRHSHHGSHRPPPRRNWFGMARPARSDVVVEEKKKKGGLGWLGMGGILAGLALVLGLKRRHDRHEENKTHSYYSGGSYYSYSESDYTTSQSSASTRGPPRSHRSGAGRSAPPARSARGSRR